MSNYNLSHLNQLEAEAIFILRETAAQFENPGLLFSAGKDSIVMAHLARKAFYPARIPLSIESWTEPTNNRAPIFSA